MATVGFIGLGNMGGPMAANLVKAGHAVTGYDLNPAALDALAKAGGKAAHSAADAVDGRRRSSSPCCPPASMCARSTCTRAA